MKILKKLDNKIVIPKKLLDYIKSLKPYDGDTWAIGTNIMKQYKSLLRTQMDKNQGGRCAYCGAKYGVTSSDQIEHIAPKATKLYPEFEFTTDNLVLACSLCNGRSHKGEIDTVNKYSKYYKRCKFTIVHPYFDDPDDNYEFSSTDKGEVIFIGKTDKALESIRMFGLNDEPKTTERAKDIVGEYKRQTESSEETKRSIDAALAYRPSYE